MTRPRFISRKAFAAWLGQHQQTRFKRGDSCECPLGRATGYVVDGSHFRVDFAAQREALPRWAMTFIFRFDNTRTGKRPTGAEASAILRRVK